MQRAQLDLAALCGALERELSGARIESVRGGPLWLSLRIGGSHLTLIATSTARLAWLEAEALPSNWLGLLDAHERSPFAPALQGATIRKLLLLRSGEGLADGLLLQLDRGELRIRWHPRPGAIWLARGEEILAQQGRMDGAALDAVEVSAASEFDLSAHAQRCRAALRELLTATARQRLRQALERGRKRRLRLRLKLIGELEQAEAQSRLRGAADAMAARLHEIAPATSELSLLDFEGITHELKLDPRRTPASNLDDLYRRIAKAERSVAPLRARLTQLDEQEEVSERVHTDELDLPALLQRALELEIDLRPARSEGERREQVRQRRLPYRAYLLPSGRELRVGRTAQDNDAMLRSHSHGQDLWLHAQGVEGSHVLLRQGPREPTRTEIELAARVAAHFSKARHSSLVPVLCTQRRHVRKPRKAAPGSVIAERGETIFVAPGLPKELQAVESE